MKEQYIVGQEANNFIRIYDDVFCSNFSRTFKDAKFLKEQLEIHKAKNIKIYKLVEIK